MSLSVIDIFKIFINTYVRLQPIALYSGSAMAGSVFKDFRGVLLFCGFLVNELLGLGYKMVLNGVSNPQCALMYSESGTPFVLPSPITQTVGFFAGFFYMDMYYNSTYSTYTFFGLTFSLLITIYSRINVGCKTLLDSIYCCLIGLLFGVVYYSLVQPYYEADYLKSPLIEADKNINNFFSVS